MAFQASNGLPTSGCIDKNTWDLLEMPKLDKPLEPAKAYELMSVYGARHSFASNAIAAGIEPSVVAEILGHSSISTTYDNYVHVKAEPIKNALAKMQDIISL